MLRKIGWKIKREQFVRKIMGEGATRTVALNWYKAVRRDDRKWRKLYPQNVLDNVHNKGYLAKNIERANILEEEGRLAEYRILTIRSYYPGRIHLPSGLKISIR